MIEYDESNSHLEVQAKWENHDMWVFVTDKFQAMPEINAYLERQKLISPAVVFRVVRVFTAYEILLVTNPQEEICKRKVEIHRLQSEIERMEKC